jgi:hypothetical protein
MRANDGCSRRCMPGSRHTQNGCHAFLQGAQASYVRAMHSGHNAGATAFILHACLLGVQQLQLARNK